MFRSRRLARKPRERDYAYAGSFYAFAIWCGMGVAAIIDMIARRFKKESVIISSVVGAVCLLIPVQMASQTWDDHDRSGRYTCRDFGQNYLNTLQDKGNPIIFTNGDNDTFPLWYNQDVEGVRTDARVCNLSYLATDWYIDQMRRPAYTSPSLPITWNRLQYCIGTNDYVEVRPELKEQVLKFYEQDKEESRRDTRTEVTADDCCTHEADLRIFLLEEVDEDSCVRIRSVREETWCIEHVNLVNAILHHLILNTVEARTCTDTPPIPSSFLLLCCPKHNRV